MVTDTLLVILWLAALRMPRGEAFDFDWEDLGAYTERCLEAWPPAARA